MKWVKYSFNVSCLPCWKFAKAVNVFLGALLVVKCVQNAFVSCLKLSMKCVDEVINHRKPTFFRVVEKVRHIIESNALDKSIDGQNDSS